MSLSTRAARDFKGTHTEGRTPEELRELVSHVGAELELTAFSQRRAAARL